MNTNHYIRSSLELHLFFARIMKEHALFLRAGFSPVNEAFSEMAERYKEEFEYLLKMAAELGNGIIRKEVACSGELVTEFTAESEKQTACLTGIAINGKITEQELRFDCGCGNEVSEDGLQRKVKWMNQRALELLNGLIAFKEDILKKVSCGEIFTMNYPLLIEHIIREARLYREYVKCLETEGRLTDHSMREVECFWNQIMMEHAQFIRGLLDPSETKLVETADGFAKKYEKLLESCRYAHARTLTGDSLEETIKFRDFKAAGTQGIQQCEIRSIILPLLADHVLREANHYIRLLKE